MSHALVLLWLGTSSARAAHQPDLDSWQRSRQVALSAPAPDSPAGLRYNPALVGRIEKLLDEARIAAGSLDENTALSRLTQVEQLLRKHPALPQAAWLMAQRLELEADINDRHQDGAARARKLRRRARALEGQRVLSYTTTAEANDDTRTKKTAPVAAGAPSAAPRALALERVRVTGPRQGDQLYIDAQRVSDHPALSAGEHHVRVVRRGRAIWAGWVRIAPGKSSLDLPVPSPAACSLDDLAGTHVENGHVAPPAQVGCRHWAVAIPSPHGTGIQVARCNGSSCGPLLDWRRGFGRDYAGPPQPAEHHGWPGWATYLLTGVGVAAAAGIVMWRTGAFEQQGTSRTVWKYQAPLGF